MSSALSPDALGGYVASIADFPEPGIMFRDISPLVGNGEAFKFAVETMADPYDGAVDLIAGVDARGFVFGAAMANHLGVGLVLIRKPGKLPTTSFRVDYDLEYGTDCLELATDAIGAGQRVLLVDDVLATGGTAKAGIDLIGKTGGALVGAQFLIEIEPLGGRQLLGNTTVKSVLKY